MCSLRVYPASELSRAAIATGMSQREGNEKGLLSQQRRRCITRETKCSGHLQLREDQFTSGHEISSVVGVGLCTERPRHTAQLPLRLSRCGGIVVGVVGEVWVVSGWA